MQIVYISNRPAVFRDSFGYVEAFMRFLDSHLVFCPADQIDQFRAISPKLSVLDEAELLGDRAGEFRATTDHQKTNYMLRSLLPRHASVAAEFLVSDDDYRPLRPIAENYFREAGKHRLFYFYAAEKWESVISRKRRTSYDLGILNALRVLRGEGLTTFVFSSHMPQIFHRDIVAASADFFAPFLADGNALPEWETYGNYALARFPERFHAPVPFTVLGWPDKPHWPWYVEPARFDFENYYPSAYAENGLFFGLPATFDSATHEKATAEKIRRYSDFFSRFREARKNRSPAPKVRQRFVPASVHELYREWRDGRPRPAPGDQGPPRAYAIAGLFGLPTGLGHAAALLERTLALSFPAERVERVDISGFFSSGRHPSPPPALVDRRGEAVVVCLNPTQGARLLRSLPRTMRRKNRLIGYWWWEFPSFPDKWRPFVRSFDEIWVSSRFLAEAWRPELDIPVRWVPLDLRQIDPSPAPEPPAAAANATIRMLSIFNFGSTLGRKNVEAAVSVLRRLCAAGADVSLTIKLGGVTAYPGRYLDFLKLDTVGEGIDVIVANFSDAEMTRLIDRHDIYLSLHRAEGLGISLAQSMLRRKVVVATRWSGNLDYMTDASSILVDWTAATLVDENGNSADPLVCAEPSMDHAVAAIASLVGDRGRMAEMGRHARLRIEEVGEAAVAHNARSLVRGG